MILACVYGLETLALTERLEEELHVAVDTCTDRETGGGAACSSGHLH